MGLFQSSLSTGMAKNHVTPVKTNRVKKPWYEYLVFGTYSAKTERIMTVEFVWNTTELIGYVGGFILSFALLPQVIHTYRTKSTRDLSYTWQVMYITGLILYYIYLVLVKATAGWVTLTLEVLMAISLLVMKLQNDGCRRPTTNVVLDGPEIKPVVGDSRSTQNDDEEDARKDVEDVALPTVTNGWSDSCCYHVVTCCSVVADNVIGLSHLTFTNALQTELHRFSSANDIVLHSCHVDALCNSNASALDNKQGARDFGVSACMGRNVHVLADYRVDEATLCLTIHSTTIGYSAQSCPTLYRSLTSYMVHFLQRHLSISARIAMQEMTTLPEASCQQSDEVCA
jgi:MtN3 and saliva related transmembrane protein